MALLAFCLPLVASCETYIVLSFLVCRINKAALRTACVAYMKSAGAGGRTTTTRTRWVGWGQQGQKRAHTRAENALM